MELLTLSCHIILGGSDFIKTLDESSVVAYQTKEAPNLSHGSRSKPPNH